MDVETRTVIRSGLDASGYKSGADQIVEANANIAASGERVAAADDRVSQTRTKLNRSLIEGSGAFDALMRKTEEGSVAAAKYASMSDRIATALRNGYGDATLAADGLYKYQQQLGLVVDIQDRMAQRTAAASEAIRAQIAAMTQLEVAVRAAANAETMRAAATAQAAYNQIAQGAVNVARTSPAQPISNPLYGDEYAKRHADITTAIADADRERASIDRVFAASKAYETQLAAINRQQEIGNISTGTQTRLIDELNASFAKSSGPLDNANKGIKAVGDAAWQTRFATQQLGVQSIQFFSSIQAGQPILTAFIQQGHQLVDVALSTGTGFGVLGSAARAVGGFLAGPGGLVVAGVAVAGAFTAMAVGAESSARRIEGLRNELSLMRDDFAAVSVQADETARHLAATTFLTTPEARAGVNAVAGTPGFTGTSAQIETIVKAFADLSRAQQKATFDSAQMAAALSDPVAFLGKMEPLLKNVDSAMVDHAKLLQSAGDKAGAFAIALKAVQDATAAVQHNLTPMEQSFRNLNDAMSGSATGGRSVFQTMGTFITDISARIVNGVAVILDALNKAGSWLDKHVLPSVGIGTPGGPLPYGMVPTTTYGGATGPGSSTWPVQQQVHDFFAAKGLPEASIAAIMAGGPGAESGFDPTRVGDGGSSYGLFQQHDPRPGVGRMTDMFTAAGTRTPSVQQQLDITWNELVTKYGPLLEILKTGGDPAALTQAFTIGFENPADAQAKAVARATTVGNYLNRFGGGGAMGAAVVNPEGGPTSGYGTGTGLDNQAKDYKKLADELSSGTVEARAQALKASLADLDKALATNPGNEKWLQAQQALTLELYNALPAAQAAVRAIELEIAAQNRMSLAWGEGAKAAAAQEIQNKALAEALKFYDPMTKEYAATVALLTIEYTKQAAAAQNLQLAQKSFDNNQQLQYLQAEIATLGQSADVRAHNLAVLKATQEVEKSFPNASAERKAAYIGEAAALADTNTQLQINTQALNELGNIATNAFSQVTNAITQSMFQSGGAVVNFGTVAKAVLTQVANSMLQLAIINPLLNATVGGQNRTTLDQILGAVGSSGSSGGGGVTGALSTGSSVLSGGSSLLELLGYKSIGTQLGLTGEGGLLTGLGAKLGLTGEGGLFSGVGSGINGLLATPVTSGSGYGLAGGFASDAAASVGGGAGGFVPAATVGSVLGAAGGGFAVGSLLGTGTQMLTNKTGYGPEIGAAVGTALGIAAAPYTGGLSLLASALIGGAAGGSIGGLIGPHPESAFSSAPVSLANGQIVVGNAIAQKDVNPGPAAVSDANTINSFLSVNGLSLASIGALTQTGQNTPGGYQDPGKFPSLSAAFPEFKFSSTDPKLDKFLTDRKYPDLDTLIADVTKYQQLVTNVIPPLTAQAKVTGSLNDALDKINAAFDPAIAAAKSFGLATDELTAAQTKAIDTTKAQAIAQLAASDATVQSNYLSAKASITGSAADAQTAALYAFDANVQPQIDALKSALTQVFGDAYTATADYATRMQALQTTLDEQRQAIIVNGQRATVSTAQGAFSAAQSALVSALNASINSTQSQIAAITNNSAALRQAADGLHAFTAGLAVSANSPLSPADQLAAARRQFQTDLAGDTAASAGAAQSDASTLLTLASAYYGKSTSAYQAVFNETVASLTAMEASLNGQASTADQSLAALTQQLTIEQQQLSVAQTVGTQIVGSISDLNEAMLTAFDGLRLALAAAGQSPGGAGQTPEQAIDTLGISASDYIKTLYQTNLHRAADPGGLSYYLAQVASGGLSLSDVNNVLRNSPEALAGHMAEGGWVANGVWGQDSVRARFAGGGDIELAGGEFIEPANVAAKYADELTAMRAGTFASHPVSNDNSALIGEIRALRAELAGVKRAVAEVGLATVSELKTGNKISGREKRTKALAGMRG